MVGGTSNMSVLADDSKKALSVYHASSLAAAVLLPTAVLADSGGAVQMACNWAIAGALPLHANMGMNWVISDYVKSSQQKLARNLTLAASVICFLGLVRVNLAGDGVVDTVKYLWEPLKTEPAAEAAH